MKNDLKFYFNDDQSCFILEYESDSSVTYLDIIELVANWCVKFRDNHKEIIENALMDNRLAAYEIETQNDEPKKIH